MSFGMLILAVVLCGIGVIITLVFSIIFFSTGKNRHALISLVTFIMFFAAIILSVIELMDRIKHAATTFGNNVRETKNSIKKEFEDWGDSVNVHLHTHKSELRDSLESYYPKSVLDTLNRDFWENEGSENDIIPLVYPYQLMCYWSPGDGGRVIRFKSKDAVTCKVDKIELVHIVRLNLDRNMILLKKDNSDDRTNTPEGEADVLYILFFPKTGTGRTFSSETQLMKEAKRAGFTGEEKLFSVQKMLDKYN